MEKKHLLNKLSSIDKSNIKNLISKLDNVIDKNVSDISNNVVELETVVGNKWKYEDMKRLCDVFQDISINKSNISKHYFQLSATSQNNSNIRYRMFIMDNIDQILQKTNSELYGSMNNLFNILLDQGNELQIKKLVPELFFQQNNYYFYIRTSVENIVNDDSKNNIIESDLTELNCIGRLITRKSYIMKETKSYKISVDCSEVTQIMNLSELGTKPQKYEVEIDIEILGNLTKNDQNEIFQKIILITDLIIRIKQNSTSIMSKLEVDNFTKSFSSLIDSNNIKCLQKIQNPKANYLSKNRMLSTLTNIISNHYITFGFGVNRSYLVLLDKVYYYRSSNEMFCVDFDVPNEYVGSILYGEMYPYLGQNVFWVEDILILQGESQLEKTPFSKTILSLKTRLRTLMKICNTLSHSKSIDFDITDSGNFKTKTDYKKKISSDISNYWKNIDSIVKKSKSNLIIAPKLYIEPHNIISTKSTSDDILWCNMLQCINNTPNNVNLKSIVTVPSNHTPNKNTILETPEQYVWFLDSDHEIIVDFYVELYKNKVTNIPSLVFDKNISNEVFISATLYNNKIEYRNMGKSVYMENLQTYDCHLKIDSNNFPRTMDGNIIRDGDIVSFALKNDRPMNKKWVPICVRNKHMGGKFNTYGDRVEFLRSALDYNSERLPFDFVKKITKVKSNGEYWKLIADVKNQMHSKLVSTTNTNELQSTVKALISRIMQKYLLPKFNHKLKKYSRSKVLEFNFNHGSMFPVYFSSMINKVTAIDMKEKNIINSKSKINQLLSETKSLVSPLFALRNNSTINRTKNPIINTTLSDITKPLKFNDQKKVFNLVKNDVDKYFKKLHTYSVVVCHYSMGAVLQDSQTLDNFMLNINSQLAENGYLITIDFDGESLKKLFLKYGHVVDLKHKDKTLLKLSSNNFDNKQKNNVTTGSTYEVENYLTDQPMFYSSNIINYEWFNDVISKKGDMICCESELLINILPIFKHETSSLSKINVDLHESFKLDKLKSIFELESEEVYKDIFSLIRYSIYQKIGNQKHRKDQIEKYIL